MVDVVFFNKIPFVISFGKCEVRYNQIRGGSVNVYLVKIPQ